MNIKEIVQLMVKQMIPVQSVICKVNKVDKNACTIDALPVNDFAEMFDVRLKSTIDNKKIGVVVFPKIGSTVTVNLIGNNVNSAYVSLVNEIESARLIIEGKLSIELKADGDIIINDGNNGGVPVTRNVKERLNRLENTVKNHQHISAGSGSPTTRDFSTNPAFNNTTESDLENNKIKH